jgi:hypothetical protein
MAVDEVGMARLPLMALTAALVEAVATTVELAARQRLDRATTAALNQSTPFTVEPEAVALVLQGLLVRMASLEMAALAVREARRASTARQRHMQQVVVVAAGTESPRLEPSVVQAEAESGATGLLVALPMTVLTPLRRTVVPVVVEVRTTVVLGLAASSSSGTWPDGALRST